MISQGYPLAGFVIGLLVGLTGVGGGSLMTPLLILVFGVHPVAAVGTDLLQAAITKTAGTAVHGLGRNVDWTIVGRLSLGSLPASAVTLLCLGQSLNSPAAGHVISVLLGVVVILTAIVVLFRAALLRFAGAGVERFSPARTAMLTVFTGFVVGVLVTLTSVGAGALGVVALAFLYPRLPMPRLVAADIAHAVPLTLLAGIGHWWLGSLHAALLGALLMGSIPGVVVGSLLVTRVPDRMLRPALALVLLLAGSKLIH